METHRTDTTGRILDVSERLFVEHGFEGTSLRMITQQAEVNLAAVNYHFGSKDALFDAVFIRRLGPLIADCLAELEQLKALARPGVSDLLMTFIRPCLSLSKDPARGGAMFVRLLSRTLVENHRDLRETVSQQYGVFVERYAEAFQRVLPDLDAVERDWRMHFAFGVMFNAFAGNDVLKIFTRSQIVSARDPDQIVKHLLPFVVSALQAGAPQ
jgi:AcrR family transcriptional regulator